MAISTPSAAVRLLGELQGAFGTGLNACERFPISPWVWCSNIFRAPRRRLLGARGICLSRFQVRARRGTARCAGGLPRTSAEEWCDQRRRAGAEQCLSQALVGVTREYQRGPEDRGLEYQARPFGADFVHRGISRSRRRGAEAGLPQLSNRCFRTCGRRQPALQPVKARDDGERCIHCGAVADQSDRSDIVNDLGGSISAEHGLGQLKREEILRYKSPLEMEMMRAVKRALDPQGLMNPGKVL